MLHLLLQHATIWALALGAMMISLASADVIPDLRILPLGDSITRGNESPDMNGYRGQLRQKLLVAQKNNEYAVDMIGTLRSGNMSDNNHEGHSGKMLAEIRQYLEKPLQAKPNIVLVHAGTNNMDHETDLDNADALMESIIDRLFEGSPGVTVLVAPVIWANDPEMQANTDAFNKKLGAIIKRKQKNGQYILPVPIDIKVDDLADKKHPNGQGYEKMAAAWYQAIINAHSRGWITSPAKVDSNKLPGLGLGCGNSTTETGAGNC